MSFPLVASGQSIVCMSFFFTFFEFLYEGPASCSLGGFLVLFLPLHELADELFLSRLLGFQVSRLLLRMQVGQIANDVIHGLGLHLHKARLRLSLSFNQMRPCHCLIDQMSHELLNLVDVMRATIPRIIKQPKRP